MLDLATLRKICEDTIARSPTISSTTPSATLTSYFIPSQLPPLIPHLPHIPQPHPHPSHKSLQ
ncbi:hypothetical protein GMOD_00003106 [Pyrenophora seminiperda CCB06]|uniref:Uncharacterized protein n=1 Tax=Pyrenophora seminiperda CCB06 TaxID=1302712 RepID=A0A3M7M3Y3_9PLEO|nr:hypothetical protein GMOD_00003106 [Pyrenophora seminiperda CCB06]